MHRGSCFNDFRFFKKMVNKNSPNRSTSKKKSTTSHTLRSKSSRSGNTMSTNRLGELASHQKNSTSHISSYLDLNNPLTMTGSSSSNYSPSLDKNNFETFARQDVKKVDIDITSPRNKSQYSKTSGEYSGYNYSQPHRKTPSNYSF